MKSQRKKQTDEADLLDRDAFAELITEQCLNQNGKLNPVYDRNRFELRDEAMGFVMSLSNIYAEYCHTDIEQRQSVISEYASVVFSQIPADFAAAKDSLFPVLYNRWSNEVLQMIHATNDGEHDLARRLTDNLTVKIVYDLPNAVMYVTTDMLKTWNTTADDVYATAIGNVRKLMAERIMSGKKTPLGNFAAAHGMTPSALLGAMHPLKQASSSLPPTGDGDQMQVFEGSFADLGFKVLRNCPGLFAASEDDWFSPSRLLVEEWIRMLGVKGDPVALVTHSGRLFVTGAEDQEGLLRMAELAAYHRGESHPVSNIPIRLTAHGWEMYQPPQKHPAYEVFQKLRVEEKAALYGWQRDHILQDPKIGTGFVASCMIGPASSGVGTISMWTRGTEPLLPETDLVAFLDVSADKNTATLVAPPTPWASVQSIVGHRMEPTEFSPTLYRAKGFPSEEEILKLQEAAREYGLQGQQKVTQGSQTSCRSSV